MNKKKGIQKNKDSKLIEYKELERNIANELSKEFIEKNNNKKKG